MYSEDNLATVSRLNERTNLSLSIYLLFFHALITFRLSNVSFAAHPGRLWIRHFESHRVELRMGKPFQLHLVGDRCILHTTAYYMPSITSEGVSSLERIRSETLPPVRCLWNPRWSRGFPSFPFLLLRNSLSN